MLKAFLPTEPLEDGNLDKLAARALELRRQIADLKLLKVTPEARDRVKSLWELELAAIEARIEGSQAGGCSSLT